MTERAPSGEIPQVVAAAREAASAAGFTRSCTDEVGRLLRVLAAGSAGPIAELGTGCGVGTAWMAASKRPDTRLVTVEADARYGAVARDVLGDVPGVEVVIGDWSSVLRHGPFALVFPDCAGAKELGDDLADSIAVGGLVIIDDLTPAWLPRPADRAGKDRDEVRESWLRRPGFAGTEVLVTPESAALIVSRLA
ncbi:O-methyltransferase [Actinomadura luteofluorescens]|uniref:O-methyltransferase n=1 Tax=Actinomadura luteofluorescens TaxID=46163 RepID=UPI00362DE612